MDNPCHECHSAFYFEDLKKIEDNYLCDICIDNYVYNDWLIRDGKTFGKKASEKHRGLGPIHGSEFSFSKKYYQDKIEEKLAEIEKLKSMCPSNEIELIVEEKIIEISWEAKFVFNMNGIEFIFDVDDSNNYECFYQSLKGEKGRIDFETGNYIEHENGIVKFGCPGTSFKVSKDKVEDLFLKLSKMNKPAKESHPRKQDRFGNTPLIYASEMGDLEDVVKMLGQNADAKIYNSEGKTALIIACENEHSEVVGKLIPSSNIDHRDNYGNTALMYACKNLVIRNILIEAGADINISNFYGWTPLLYGSSRGKSKYDLM